MYTNICSLLSKFDDLNAFVQLHTPHCLLITESWLHPNIPDSIVNIANYEIFRTDSVTTVGHGGVCIYIHQTLMDNFSVKSFSLDTPGVDCMFVGLVSSHLSWTVGCIYRPRASGYDTEVFDTLAKLAAENEQILIAGDFNLPEIKWPLTGAQTFGNSPAGYLSSVVRDSNLIQLINEPTRFRINQRPSLLDLIFVNNDEPVCNIHHLSPLGKSDHAVLQVDLQFSIEVVPGKAFKMVSIVNYDKTNSDLLNVSWQNKLCFESVDQLWTGFKEVLQSTVAKNTRFKKVRFNPRKPWISDNLLQMALSKRALWQKYRRTGSESDFIAHRRFSNDLSLLLRRARLDFDNRVASGSDKKLFYKTVRRSLQSKVTSPVLQRDSGSVCTSKGEIANIFATYFAETFIKEPPGAVPQIPGVPNSRELNTISFSTDVVHELLRSQRVTAPGPDLVDSLLLKRCCEGLASPLSLIMQESFRRHSLPRDWLHGVVTPIFKKGNRLLPSNYRPITLTSLVCKIAEKIIHKQVLQFCLDNAVLPPEQHGFIPGRSVVTNLLNCVNDWTRCLDRNEPVDVIYLDFAKAFDRVPKRRLLAKLDHYGVRGDLLKFIDSYLTGRTFQVKVDRVLSAPFPVSSGVPQGSTLGPLLFLVYMADLKQALTSRCSFYADDVKIYGNPLDPKCQLQPDLGAVQGWCDNWLVPLNDTKCTVLHMGRNNPWRGYSIHGTGIEAVDKQMDLGVVISADLSWSDHIAHVASKANKVLYMISKAFPGCNLRNLATFYRVYVRPILEYAGAVWFPTLQRDIDLLEGIQRKATRLTLGISRPSYEVRKQVCGLTSFMDRKLRGDLITTYRALHGLFGVDLEHLFELNLNHLRGHDYKLRREKFSTSARASFLSNRIFHQWNALPVNVVNARSVNQFKNNYDQCVVSDTL